MTSTKVELIIDDTNYDLSNIVAYPINISFTLDKTLDNGNFRIPATKVDQISGLELDTPIRPLTKCLITIDDVEHYFYTGESKCKRLGGGDSEVWTHSIQIIEATKMLERSNIPDMTVTQTQESDIYYTSISTDDATDIPLKFNLDGDWKEIPMKTVANSIDHSILDALTMKDIGREFNITSSFKFKNSKTVTDYLAEVALYVNGVLQTSKEIFVDDATIFNPTVVFDYITLIYTALTTSDVLSLRMRILEATTYFGLPDLKTTEMFEKADIRIYSSDEVNTPDITLTDSINKMLLYTSKVSDINDTSFIPKYTLGETTEARLLDVISPELSLDKMSLWDGLSEISNITTAFPRLSDWNTLEFDFLDDLNNSIITIPNKMSEQKQWLLNDYANSLEINADNVVETSNILNTKIEPYIGGWQTLRAREDQPVQIKESNSAYKTRDNIYRIKKIECTGFVVDFTDASSNSQATIYDLTDYVFEKKRYDIQPDAVYEDDDSRLNKYKGKGNTLYYTEGTNIIDGFAHRGKQSGIVAILTGEPDYSIFQAIRCKAQEIENDAASGKVVDNSNVTGYDLFEGIYFRIEYIPFSEVRGKTYKHNARDFEQDVTLYSNERARINDAEALGSFNQATVNRIGNITTITNGIVTNYNEIPKIGNRTSDNDVITRVDATIGSNYHTFGLTLVKDYAGISDFISVDSKLRQYRVPKDDYVTRNDIYEEHWTVGRTFKANRSHTILTTLGIRNIIIPFSSIVGSNIDNSSYARYSTRFNEYNPGDAEWLTFDTRSHATVNATPLGRSTVLDIQMKDNYSAGNFRDDVDYQIDGKDAIFQDDYPYTDIYGRVDSIRIELFPEGEDFSSPIYDKTYSDTYPNAEAYLQPSAELAVIDIRKKKDGREKLKDTLQFNFFSQVDSNGEEELRLYNGISKFNGLNTRLGVIDVKPVLLRNDYFPSHNDITINEGNIIYAPSVAKTLVGVDSTLAYIDYEFTIEPTTVAETYNGYALIDDTTKELILAVREDITSDDTTSFNHTDTIYFYSDKTKGL